MSTATTNQSSKRRILPTRRSSTAQLEATLLVSTYQRPGHLRRALLAIELQQGAEGKFEVVVTDDGSEDETADVVAEFARRAPFPVHFTTHPHAEFQLAKCRNEGVAATTAPYLLFLDGDLVVPPDFVQQHLARRKPGWALAGDSYYLDQETSERIDERTIRSGEFMQWTPAAEKKRISRKAIRAHLYRWMRHPTRPTLKGGNIAMWRNDYLRVNGYDENFVGWGLEETDLQYRLARCGVRFGSSMGWTATRHLWHPPTASFVPRAEGTDNQNYLRQPGRLACCRNGLRKRSIDELRIRVAGSPARDPRFESFLNGRCVNGPQTAEVEVLFWPGDGAFTDTSDCRVLVVLDDVAVPHKLVKRASMLVSDAPLSLTSDTPRFRLSQFDDALASIA